MSDELLKKFGESNEPTAEEPCVVWAEGRAQMLELRAANNNSLALPYAKLENASCSGSALVILVFHPLGNGPAAVFVKGSNLSRLYRDIITQKVRSIVCAGAAAPPEGSIVVDSIQIVFGTRDEKQAKPI